MHSIRQLINQLDALNIIVSYQLGLHNNCDKVNTMQREHAADMKMLANESINNKLIDNDNS